MGVNVGSSVSERCGWRGFPQLFHHPTSSLKELYSLLNASICCKLCYDKPGSSKTGNNLLILAIVTILTPETNQDLLRKDQLARLVICHVDRHYANFLLYLWCSITGDRETDKCRQKERQTEKLTERGKFPENTHNHLFLFQI